MGISSNSGLVKVENPHFLVIISDSFFFLILKFFSSGIKETCTPVFLMSLWLNSGCLKSSWVVYHTLRCYTSTSGTFPEDVEDIGKAIYPKTFIKAML